MIVNAVWFFYLWLCILYINMSYWFLLFSQHDPVTKIVRHSQLNGYVVVMESGELTAASSIETSDVIHQLLIRRLRESRITLMFIVVSLCLYQLVNLICIIKTIIAMLYSSASMSCYSTCCLLFWYCLYVAVASQHYLFNNYQFSSDPSVYYILCTF